MKKLNKKAFSIIEVLVGIVIFIFGITGIYTIIHSTLNLNDYNKNYIISTNLAREQLELFRNIRDSNFKVPRNYLLYDSIKSFEYGKTYKISNDFSSTTTSTVKVKEEKINLTPGTYDLSQLEKFQVCIDTTTNLYDYCSNISGDKKELRIYKLISLEKIGAYDINEAVKVKSKVIWYSKRFSEFEVEEIFTNYKIY